MNKFLFCGLALLLFGALSQPVQARGQPEYAPHLLSKDDLQEMVLAHRIDAVEREMQVARLAYAVGDADHDHLRWLNEVFGSTSPKVARFAREWLETYPDSPHAHIANAWVAFQVGWTVRGERSAGRTYHDALRAFSKAMYEAEYHAMEAYQLDLKLLPATDALIYLGTMGYGNLPLDGLINTIMTEQPNAGTVLRANTLAYRGWGYDQDYGNRICETYGPRVPEWGDEGADICKVIHSHDRFGSEPFDWFVSTLEALEYDDAQLKLIRAKTVLYRDVDNSDWEAELIAMFADPLFTDLDLAIEYDRRYAARYPYLPLASPQVRPRAKKWAKARLKIEPYDVDAIRILTDQMVYHRALDGTIYPEIDRKIARQIDREDMARRLVLAKPWDGNTWLSFASAITDTLSVEGFDRWRGAKINAVVYSNYGPNYLMHLIQGFWWFNKSIPLYAKNPDPKRRAFLEALDVEQELRCPIARATVILGRLCDHKELLHPAEHGACDFLDRKADDLKHLITPLHENRSCGIDLDRNEAGLLFTPVEMDLSTPDEL